MQGEERRRKGEKRKDERRMGERGGEARGISVATTLGKKIASRTVACDFAACVFSPGYLEGHRERSLL